MAQPHPTGLSDEPLVLHAAPARYGVGMALSGTVPSRSPAPLLQPTRYAKWVRRFGLVTSILVFTWFLLQFGTRWVPAGMNTLQAVPGGSWCIVDRWSIGLRVGSQVFVDAPVGVLLSTVKELGHDTVTIEHDVEATVWPDSRSFGPLPLSKVLATVIVVFPPDVGADRGR